MDIQQLLILLAIGILAGMLSGFIGIGGGVVIVPALIYFMGMSQFQAQGTSLAMMLPPIGILAFMNYYKSGHINLQYAGVIAIAFIIGGFLGSKIALKMNPTVIKFIFGIIMLYVSFRLIWTSSFKLFGNDA
ncbi:MAG: sulfite exporter TauE/SafE family protein [Flavobacteriales bacterium]|nr:sulfite exporter TauE/SafE family protein [Flavobacteriales bacterium]MDG1781244.1 sulfite exporter TauE/SafE family protein [Flavobacteriales bacterium]MDG2245389.1 sulfite exporter TauE/SafE family protein [Flavobacteriales bacterium]